MSKLMKVLADAKQANWLCPQNPLGYFMRGRVRLERQTEGGLSNREKAAMLHALTEDWFAESKCRRL